MPITTDVFILHLLLHCPVLMGRFFNISECIFFYIEFIIYSGSKSPCIFQQPQFIFERAHFSWLYRVSFMCWGTVIFHHRLQGPTLFQRKIWYFMCMHRHRTSCIELHSRRLGYILLILYLRGLQQPECQEWESNLCPSARTGLQIQVHPSRPLLSMLTLGWGQNIDC